MSRGRPWTHRVVSGSCRWLDEFVHDSRGRFLHSNHYTDVQQQHNICQGWCGCGMCAIIRVRFLELLFLFKYRCKMLDNGPFLYEHFICHAAVSLAEQHL